MELVFLAILIGMMMLMLGIGFPVAFSLPGAASGGRFAFVLGGAQKLA